MRRRTSNHAVEELQRQRALLAALSDDLALPLLQIKTTLEVLGAHKLAKKSQSYTQSMSLTTTAGLQLIEAYRLALLASDNSTLTMEPVSVGAVLQDVAHQLTPYAKQYTTELIVDVRGKLTPVLAHRQSLVAAMECLSTSMIRAQAAQVNQKKYKLVLGAHRSADNVISAGVFSSTQGISDKTLRRARSLIGLARQPLPDLPPGSASGILIADMLCSIMWQPLRSAAHRNLQGLATSVPISKQLQFV